MKPRCGMRDTPGGACGGDGEYVWMDMYLCCSQWNEKSTARGGGGLIVISVRVGLVEWSMVSKCLLLSILSVLR